MLPVQIEKEIDIERKFVKGFTLRQAICIGGIAASCIAAYSISKDSNITTIVATPVGLVLGVIGWGNMDGLKAEEVVKIFLNRVFFKNSVRKYRTKNTYVTFFNNFFATIRNSNMSDKRKVKYAKKEQKRVEKRQKHSKIKAIM